PLRFVDPDGRDPHKDWDDTHERDKDGDPYPHVDGGTLGCDSYGHCAEVAARKELRYLGRKDARKDIEKLSERRKKLFHEWSLLLNKEETLKKSIRDLRSSGLPSEATDGVISSLKENISKIEDQAGDTVIQMNKVDAMRVVLQQGLRDKDWA